MAITLWSTKTPGTAQLERDIAVMNNKKKVSLRIPSHVTFLIYFLIPRSPGHQDADAGGGSLHAGLAAAPAV